MPLLQAHLTMLPRLGAEEALSDAEVLAVGTGAMKPAARVDVVAAWRQAAEIPTALKPRDRAAHAAQLAAAGIGIRMVPKVD